MQTMIEMFGLTKPVWDIAIRSTAAFLALVALIRVVPKRNAGNLSPNDMLIVVVIGGIAGDAITGGSTSAGDLLLMIALVLLWGYVFDFLEYNVPFFRRLMRHKQSLLIEDGRMLRRNMRREMITEEEMLSALRREGISNLSEVKSATLEADGEISLLRKDRGGEETEAPAGAPSDKLGA